MTIIAHTLAFGRALLTNDFGSSSVRTATLIGLSASTLLVLARVGVAFAQGVPLH